jgi:hypothetical protein
MVQHPGRLPEVAMELLSGQGTGKGLFMQYLGSLFGRHYKHITDKNHLLGIFSRHLHDAVCTPSTPMEQIEQWFKGEFLFLLT